MAAKLPIAALTPTVLRLGQHRLFPGNELPVVHYRPFSPGSSSNLSMDPGAIEALVSQHGFVPAWRYGMYPYDHFHSTTHELLVAYAGRATVMLNGDTHELDMRAGDVLLIPAGVAHRAKEAEGFRMVGSYPVDSAQWDDCKGGEQGAQERIEKLDKGGVSMDPIYGNEAGAPVNDAWGL